MVFGQLVMPVQCCAGAPAARRCVGFVFTMGFHDGFCIHDGFLDSQWVLGFTMGSWVHDEVHVKSLDFFEPCAKAAKVKPLFSLCGCSRLVCAKLCLHAYLMSGRTPM